MASSPGCQPAPADRVGTVTGIVGAAGGLGGFFPPLVMGATYNEAATATPSGLASIVQLQLGAGLRSDCVFGICAESIGQRP